MDDKERERGHCIGWRDKEPAERLEDVRMVIRNHVQIMYDINY